jgi:prepilin-type processing-associated H-X9-DG protein/prepilin-type N-terminal cleavage/methylation domain-containing protein
MKITLPVVRNTKKRPSACAGTDRVEKRAVAKRPFARIGFTLVELLVVIAIIAILAAIILPIGKRMMESSNASKCASNLRQLYLAANRWTADNDGWMLPTFPTGRNADNRINAGWVTALFPYLSPGVNLWGASDVGKRPKGCLACPSSDFLILSASTGWCSDYAKNAVVNVSLTNPSYPLRKMGGMENSSKVIFLADGEGRDLSPFRTNGLIVNRHNGKANVLFYDGHVEALDSSDTNQIPLVWNRQPWQQAPPAP